MKLWKRWTGPPRNASATRSSSLSSDRPDIDAGSAGVSVGDSALSETLTWLAQATGSESAPVNLEAARVRLEARVAGAGPSAVRDTRAWSVRGGAAARSHALRTTWPARAVASAAVLCCLLFLLWRHVSPLRPAAAPVQQVRFDPSLWELDSIAAAPTGDATAEMIRHAEW